MGKDHDALTGAGFRDPDRSRGTRRSLDHGRTSGGHLGRRQVSGAPKRNNVVLGDDGGLPQPLVLAAFWLLPAAFWLLPAAFWLPVAAFLPPLDAFTAAVEAPSPAISERWEGKGELEAFLGSGSWALDLEDDGGRNEIGSVKPDPPYL